MKIKTIVIELENGSEFRTSGHSLEDSRKFIDRIFEIAGHKSDSISGVSVCTCDVPKYTWLTSTKAFCHTCENISS